MAERIVAYTRRRKGGDGPRSCGEDGDPVLVADGLEPHAPDAVDMPGDLPSNLLGVAFHARAEAEALHKP